MTDTPAIREITLADILQWNATREVRSMRTRNIRRINKPYACREVVFTCSNGWRIEKLPPKDFSVEGFFMGHCLGGSNAPQSLRVAYSLREPDGTPHVTIARSKCYGRANQAPRQEYMDLVHEWEPSLRPEMHWGKDTDTAYHDKGYVSDKDYRDLPAGKYWRDSRWHTKRGK